MNSPDKGNYVVNLTLNEYFTFDTDLDKLSRLN